MSLFANLFVDFASNLWLLFVPFHQIIQTFFVSAISGSIFSGIAYMLENPASIVKMLAVSLPAQVRAS